MSKMMRWLVDNHPKEVSNVIEAIADNKKYVIILGKRYRIHRKISQEVVGNEQEARSTRKYNY
jgi:hypothetical protein